MSRIKAFRFEWTDAWHHIDDGYDCILETTDSGTVCIKFLINNKTFQLELTDRENEFIEDMAFLKGWNKNSYDFWIEDASHWRLFFSYDDTVIVSKGNNGYPADFARFLSLLHKKYNLPKARIEPDDKTLSSDIKNTDVRYDETLDRTAIYF